MGALQGEQGILPGTPFPFAAVFLPLGWERGGLIFSVCGDLVAAAPKANPTRSPILFLFFAMCVFLGRARDPKGPTTLGIDFQCLW